MSKNKQETVEADSNDEVSEEQLDGSTIVDPDETKKVTFASLGLNEVLCNTCEKMGWTHASAIQAASIPYALQGKDVIGLAQTGSGKTASFALPILHNLLLNPQQLYALVMAPTRYGIPISGESRSGCDTRSMSQNCIFNYINYLIESWRFKSQNNSKPLDLLLA